jgi:hypothetical protein
VSNWSDKIVVIGVGISMKKPTKSKKLLLKRLITNPSYDILDLFSERGIKWLRKQSRR